MDTGKMRIAKIENSLIADDSIKKMSLRFIEIDRRLILLKKCHTSLYMYVVLFAKVGQLSIFMKPF